MINKNISRQCVLEKNSLKVTVSDSGWERAPESRALSFVCLLCKHLLINLKSSACGRFEPLPCVDSFTHSSKCPFEQDLKCENVRKMYHHGKFHAVLSDRQENSSDPVLSEHARMNDSPRVHLLNWAWQTAQSRLGLCPRDLSICLSCAIHEHYRGNNNSLSLTNRKEEKRTSQGTLWLWLCDSDTEVPQRQTWRRAQIKKRLWNIKLSHNNHSLTDIDSVIATTAYSVSRRKHNGMIVPQPMYSLPAEHYSDDQPAANIERQQ